MISFVKNMHLSIIKILSTNSYQIRINYLVWALAYFMKQLPPLIMTPAAYFYFISMTLALYLRLLYLKHGPGERPLINLYHKGLSLYLLFKLKPFRRREEFGFVYVNVNSTSLGDASYA